MSNHVMSKSANQQHTAHANRAHSGFTLVELLVVIAIIAILSAILFPAFSRSRENARRAACQSNLKQIGLGVIQYSQDNDERYPFVDGLSGTDIGNGALYWPSGIYPYVKSTQMFKCPNEASTNAVSYLMNNYVGKNNLSMVEQPSTLVLATDGNNGISNSKLPTDTATQNGLNNDYSLWCQRYRVANTDHGTPRHTSRDNFLYCDGHVKISPAIPTPTSGTVPTIAQLEAAIPFTPYIAPTSAGFSFCTGWQ